MSRPSMRTLRDFPFGSRTIPRAGVRARAFATAATSPVKFEVAARQAPPLQ